MNELARNDFSRTRSEGPNNSIKCARVIAKVKGELVFSTRKLLFSYFLVVVVVVLDFTRLRLKKQRKHQCIGILALTVIDCHGSGFS